MIHQSFGQWLSGINEMQLPVYDSETVAFLKALEAESEIYWNIPEEVGQFFQKLILKLRPMRLMEVGTSSGYSAIVMGFALRQNLAIHNVDGRLFTIESHQGRFDLAGQNILKAGVQNFVTQIKGHAPEIFHSDENLKLGSFDLVFFDGIKKQHIDFLEQSLGLLKEGGVLIADNVRSHWKDMEAFVKRVDELGLFEGQIMEMGDGVYIGIKKES